MKLKNVGVRNRSKTFTGKVTGQTLMNNDYSVEGTLRLKFKRSPYAHARIISMDTSKAEKVKGVWGILTPFDKEAQTVVPCHNWFGEVLPMKARFVGDEVAAVAAETEEAALEAIDLIKVEYEVLPAVFDMDEALKDDAPYVHGEELDQNMKKVHPQYSGNRNKCTGPYPPLHGSELDWGDIEKGFAESDVVIEAELRGQRQITSYMPQTLIARWEGERLLFWTLGAHSPFNTRSLLAGVLGIKPSKVTVYVPMVVGASMGAYNSSHRCYSITAILAKKTGRPVSYKMTLEDLGIYKHRHSTIHRIKMGATKDGKVMAIDYLNLFDNGAYGSKVSPWENHIDIFSTSNVKARWAGVFTNLPMCGCLRAVGNVGSGPAIGEAGDILAEKVGIDPISFWKKNHYHAGDPIRCSGNPFMPLSSEDFDRMIDTGAEAIGWNQKWKGWGVPYQVSGSKKRGVGMALNSHMSSVQQFPSGAHVNMAGGTAIVNTGFVDMGTDNSLMFAEVAADTIGLKLEDVEIIRTFSTEANIYNMTTGASPSAFQGTAAIYQACMEVKNKLLQLASTMPFCPDLQGQPVENLDIEDGFIFVKDNPEKRAPVTAIARLPNISGFALDHNLERLPRSPQQSVMFADIEVDTETGMINVLKLHINQNSGRILNPDSAENNIYGAAATFLGYGLYEDIIFDPKTGTTLNGVLSDYPTPTTLDMPEMEVAWSKDIDTVNPYGAKGMGEAPIAVHQAIRAALYNATGCRIAGFPLTPDKVLKALGKI
ncbi:MAG TPA: hypothetical protein DD636_01120 [Anaerolineaceae bacterium]|nr:hypothetical protein [Anaerolineaceae bacterium]